MSLKFVIQAINEDINEIKKNENNLSQTITLQELVTFLKSLNAKNPIGTAYTIFNSMDKIKIGKLDKEDIKKWSENRHSQAIEQALINEVNLITKMMKKDNNSKISFGEMIDYYINVNLGIDNAFEITKNYFIFIDDDKDGFLTVSELKKFVGADIKLPQM